MDRRAFIGALAGSLLAAPLAAEGQQAGKVYRVGLIFPSPPVSEMAGPEPVNPAARAFVRSLRDAAKYQVVRDLNELVKWRAAQK